MADVLVLICTAGDLAGERIVVPEGGLDFGRSSDNHVVITDDGVSRFHARMLFDNGSLWLQDAGSRNGIFVNGTRVTQHQALKSGDQVTIALHQFVVRLESNSGVPAPTRNKATGNEETTEEEDGTKPRSWFWPFKRNG